MTTLNKTLDLITLGQIHVDLCGEQIGASLKDMQSFKKAIAGSPATVAMGCTRLKLKTAIISSVSEDPMGKFILEVLREEKIDISQIQSQPELMTPIVLRSSENNCTWTTLPYGEENTAVFSETELDLDFITQSHTLLIPASYLVQGKGNYLQKTLSHARKNGTQVILLLDLDADEVISLPYLHKIVAHCDLIIGSEDQFKQVANAEDIQSVLEQIRKLSNALLIMRDSQGYYAFAEAIPTPWNNTTFQESPYQVENLDAFAVGFLKGWLEKNLLQKCCQLGVACQVIVQSRSGSAADLPSEEGLFLYLTEHQVTTQILQSTHFNHIHYATTRPVPLDQHCIFNFGLHQQWQKVAQNFEADEATIQKAKYLIAQGLNIVGESNPFSAMITGDNAPVELMQLQPTHFKLLRCVEAPNEVPLQFKHNPDITQTLLQWPKSHCAKATIIYHPDDRYALRGQQEASLGLLYQACRATGHELFLEIAPPTNSLITASTIAHIIHRFYELGIYPDAWLLSPPRELRSWESASRVIAENDPYCQGILLVGQNATLEQLTAMFEATAKQKYCKGFVAGRNIFQACLEQWFAQRISDDVLIEKVASQFQEVLNIWDRARQPQISAIASTA